MDENALLKLALDAGEIMLTSGAETHRVEDTMHHILSVSHNTEAEALAMSTLLIVSLPSEKRGSLTLTRGVHSRSVNFQKICEVNAPAAPGTAYRGNPQRAQLFSAPADILLRHCRRWIHHCAERHALGRPGCFFLRHTDWDHDYTVRSAADSIFFHLPAGRISFWRGSFPVPPDPALRRYGYDYRWQHYAAAAGYYNDERYTRYHGREFYQRQFQAGRSTCAGVCVMREGFEW